MDFKRLAQITRKIVKGNKRISSTSEQITIFVKQLPLNYKSAITLTVQPLDKVAAIKEQIEAKTRYLVSRQSLLLVSGKRLDDRKTLAAYNICKDSTLYLKLKSGKLIDDSELLAACNSRKGSALHPKLKEEVTPCDIEIQILPINRFLSLRIPRGLSATIRELKDLIVSEEGIQCGDFYLDDDVSDEHLGDNVTLAACGVHERTLVLVQSDIEFLSNGRHDFCYSRSEVKRRVSRRLLDVAFNEAFNATRTVPGLGDMEQLKVRTDPPEQNNQHGEVLDIETAIATILQTHQDCERKLTLMLDEKNKLQTDLLELQAKYPKLLSDVLEERNRLDQDLKQLRSEFPRQLSRVLEEKNRLQEQLVEVQSDFDRQVSFVLDENHTIEKELATLKIELGREKEKSLCSICFDNPRDTLVFSCLHLHFCSSCLQKHQERTNTCPTCRGFISGKLICNVSVS